MPIWTNSLPEDNQPLAHRIRRTPVGGKLLGIVTASDLLGCNTHYFHGRTVPCEAPNCPACDQGLGWRFHAYLSALDPTSNDHFIFEMTALAAEVFVTYKKAHGTLRGCLFQAVRLGTKPNGRVTIQTKPADLQTRALPDPPDIKRILCVLWNVPDKAAQPASHHRPYTRIHVDQTTQTPENSRNGRTSRKS